MGGPHLLGRRFKITLILRVPKFVLKLKEKMSTFQKISFRCHLGSLMTSRSLFAGPEGQNYVNFEGTQVCTQIKGKDVYFSENFILGSFGVTDDVTLPIKSNWDVKIQNI